MYVEPTVLINKQMLHKTLIYLQNQHPLHQVFFLILSLR